MNRIGFFRAVLLDEAAFYQVLCTSSLYMTRLRQRTEDGEAIILYTKAIRSIHKRITDPVLCTSDGVLVTVLTLVSHAVSILLSIKWI
jgi:hypothetical protein